MNEQSGVTPPTGRPGYPDWQRLPPELFSLVLAKMNFQDKISTERVCHLWHRTLRHSQVLPRDFLCNRKPFCALSATPLSDSIAKI